MNVAGCTSKKEDYDIVVRGNIKNIPAKKLYLSDAYQWKKFIDSAEYKNDTFSFRINEQHFEPFLASIAFIKEGRIQHLTYRNHVLSNNEKRNGTTGFMLGYGITTISGTIDTIEHNVTNNLKISSNPQNDAMLKTLQTGFGFINAKSQIKRNKIIDTYKDLIKEYPDSYYLLSQLDVFKDLYREDELLALLSLFNTPLQNSIHSKSIVSYFKILTPPGTPLPNLLLTDNQLNPKRIIDHSKKINMLVFWASWCGPCRKEIPDLKLIHESYKNVGLHMVSISMDEDEGQWKNAMKEEKMNWDQLIINNEVKERIKANFGFTSIPTVIFTDSEGVEKGRFSGYDADRKNEYKSLLQKLLYPQ